MIMGAGTKFRQVLAKSGLVEAMAAHSPLSAMLAAEAGFDAIWASGFELSAMYGVPDVSVVSMTQHLDMTRAMADRSGLPVVADIDTGFGNAINVLYAIEQYERAGAAAIVMEDKSFPKVTSLIAGGRQDMVRIEEFQGKIEAALTARRRHDPGPFQAEDAGRDRGLREGVGRQGADRPGADGLSADDGGAGA
jgi:phosphoenolpyruvate phosphomutase